MLLDPKRGLASAKLADAAYIEDMGDAITTFAALGHKMVDAWSDPLHQAYVTSEAGADCLDLHISGSRVSGRSKIDAVADMIADMDVAPHDLGNGILVTRGPYLRSVDIFGWADTKYPGAKWRIRGCHSLGGWVGKYAFSHLKPENVILIDTFASPKGANAAYYAGIPAEHRVKFTNWCNERDLWMGYSWLGPFVQLLPDDKYPWLHNGGIAAIDESEWPGGTHATDHDIETGYTANLAKAQGVPAAPAAVVT